MKRKKNTVHYLDEAELAALFRAIAAAGSARDLAIFEVAYHRGLRASEVGLLRPGHLRKESRRLYVTRLKSGTSGEYLLTDREIKALRNYLRRLARKLTGPLFPSRQKGPITRIRLHQLMQQYAAAAGIPPEKRHFHCLRHSCGTQLLKHDVPIEEVMDHLGHTDIRKPHVEQAYHRAYLRYAVSGDHLPSAAAVQELVTPWN